MKWLVLASLMLLAAAPCDQPSPPERRLAPKPGDFVKLRGTLSEDVDCRVLRTEDGTAFSLSAKLPSWRNGAKVCVHGTVAEVSPCMLSPMIEVQSVRPWSSCP